MNYKYLPCLLGALGISAMLLAGRSASSQEESAANEGVEVLARGPVHEAYAEPIDSQPRATPVVPKQPPDPVEEVPPDEKPEGEGVQWIAGYWAWDEDRNDFLWVSGFWRVPPPGRQWVPGHWQQVEGGYQWTPGLWTPLTSSELEYAPPPPPSVESGPSIPAPGENYVYEPGCWVYRESHYAWQPGFWCAHRPGWVWVPAHHVWTPCGCVFVAGYWDYSLRERGLLFAPVCIDYRLREQPHYCYTPSYVVYDDCLQGALFVRPSCGHYYFGDYFGERYERRGFTAWVDFRIGGRCSDPLFSCYACSHRKDAGWERDLRSLYVGRRRGDIAPPPRTLVQQNTLIQNTVVNNSVTSVTNVTNVKNVTVLAPLHQVDPNIVRLARVTPEQRVQEQRAAVQLRATAVQRHQVESQLLAQGPAPVRVSDPVRRVKLDLPPAPAARTVSAVRTPPPPPGSHRSAPASAVHPEPALTAVPHPEARPASTAHHDNVSVPPAANPQPPAPRKETVPPTPPAPKHEVAPMPPHHDPGPAAPRHEGAVPGIPHHEPAPLSPSPLPPTPKKETVAPPPQPHHEPAPAPHHNAMPSQPPVPPSHPAVAPATPTTPPRVVASPPAAPPQPHPAAPQPAPAAAPGPKTGATVPAHPPSSPNLPRKGVASPAGG